MDLAGLWVDHIGGNAHTLLFPHRVFKIQACSHVCHAADESLDSIELTSQTIIGGFDAGNVGNLLAFGIL